MKRLIVLLMLLLLVAACDQEVDQETPEPIEPTLALSPTATLSPEPSPTVLLVTPSPTFPPTLTPTVSATPAPPTDTPGPTNTPGPYEHQVRTGDDCIGILYQYGHVDLDALQVLYDLNQLGGCTLPSVGGMILVPRPTAADSGEPIVTEPLATSPFSASDYEAYGEYCVTEGDTLTSIALKANTSLRRICELNPLPDGLDCRGCDFSLSDVGSCPNPPLIGVGDCFTVPAATPQPSATLPPSGDETPTPTPTHRAPLVVYPPNGAVVRGSLRLQWASVGLLGEGEYYVVNLTDASSGALFIDATKATFMNVPLDYVPRDGTAHSITWFVSVQAMTPDGLFVPVGGRSADYGFTWE